MKKWLWIPITLIVVFVGDRLLGGMLASITEGSEFRYSRLYSGRAEADIVLLGNSRGLSFYQPFLEQRTGARRSTLAITACQQIWDACSWKIT